MLANCSQIESTMTTHFFRIRVCTVLVCILFFFCCCWNFARDIYWFIRIGNDEFLSRIQCAYMQKYFQNKGASLKCDGVDRWNMHISIEKCHNTCEIDKILAFSRIYFASLVVTNTSHCHQRVNTCYARNAASLKIAHFTKNGKEFRSCLVFN